MFRIAALAASVLLVATAASAEILVFKSGQSMSVRSYRVDGDLATAVLRAGGEVTFPAAMITRVDPDEVPYPVPVDELPVEAAPATAVPAGVPDAVLAARPFADLISGVAASHQVDARLIHAVIEQESNY